MPNKKLRGEMPGAPPGGGGKKMKKKKAPKKGY